MRKRERLLNAVRSENRNKEDGGRNGNWTRNDIRKHLGDDHRSKDSNRSPASAPSTKVFSSLPSFLFITKTFYNMGIYLAYPFSPNSVKKFVTCVFQDGPLHLALSLSSLS